MRELFFLVLLQICGQVEAVPPECDAHLILLKEEESCYDLLHRLRQNLSDLGSNRTGMWDSQGCWYPAVAGETVAVSCPELLITLTGVTGWVYRNCTSEGWSHSFPEHHVACGYDSNVSGITTETGHYFKYMKIMYSVGYGLSLVSLIIAIGILCFFRKLHCTRNYIHIQLFTSFILRALSVFVRDAVLFSNNDIYHCNVYPVGCKMVMVFCHYCIMANYSWLLVEGLYLHTLLNVSFFSERKFYWCYLGLGWGSPMFFTIAWSVAKMLYEDIGCWNSSHNTTIRWVIRGPVITSILINFLFFISILRILMLKLKTPNVGGNDLNQYKRLAKSTLLLIPLFGAYYILFTFFPDNLSILSTNIRLTFELALASTQGFVVAVLYCFLNGEVQYEIQRRRKRRTLRQCLRDEPRPNHSSISHSGAAPTQVSLLTREQRNPSHCESSLA
ncbi:secretin receptor isoform X2 [Lepisosteus oculatus]|uniref:secretin receptor isoform X2 n=1 Tax=Lepisosteus oculatus TaxID=7918 RepID=UPI0035F51EE2